MSLRDAKSGKKWREFRLTLTARPATRLFVEEPMLSTGLHFASESTPASPRMGEDKVISARPPAFVKQTTGFSK